MAVNSYSDISVLITNFSQLRTIYGWKNRHVILAAIRYIQSFRELGCLTLKPNSPKLPNRSLRTFSMHLMYQGVTLN